MGEVRRGLGLAGRDLTHEADRADLERHAEEIERHETFNYAVVNEDDFVPRWLAQRWGFSSVDYSP